MHTTIVNLCNRKVSLVLKLKDLRMYIVTNDEKEIYNYLLTHDFS